MGESFQKYLIAVGKHWKWLVVDLLVGVATTFTTLLSMPVSIALPIGLAIIFIGLSVAQFLAYHNLREVNINLEAKLVEANMYDAKKQRIAIIDREKYPTEVVRILDNMRKCLTLIVENTDKIDQKITPEQLQESISPINPHQLYLALHKRTINDNVSSVFDFYNAFHNDIGLINLQQMNETWKQLIEDLEGIKKDIPDQDLKEYIISHFKALNGSFAISLYYHYLQKYGATQTAVNAVREFRPYYDLLDQTLTRISKRILELKLGAEPKWEVKYYELR